MGGHKNFIILVQKLFLHERAYTLQSQFLLCSLAPPEDALLHSLLPLIRQPRSHAQWYKLCTSPTWKRCSSSSETLDRRSLRSIRRECYQTTSEIKILRMSPFSLCTVAQISLLILSYGYLCPSLEEVDVYAGVLTGSLVVDTKLALGTLVSPSQKPIPFTVSRCTVDS